MQTRIVGSVLVVAVGLIPTLIGGPIFALFMVALGIAGFREYLRLADAIAPADRPPSFGAGGLVLVALGLAPLISTSAEVLLGLLFAAFVLSLGASLPRARQEGAIISWALESTGIIYLGIPMYAAVALRSLPGAVSGADFSQVVDRIALGWDPAPRGLAWALTVILATWIGDSTAYLTGRAFGRTKLAPSVSPGKTVEGAVGGLLGSMLICVATFMSFGIGPWWSGAISGLLIGALGQIGDLAESFFKRQAGVKDSGEVIPGHGGILDRIDALLFAFPTGLIIATGLERLQGG